jgi:glycosyltransferase involved in cell wall biosynthesis
MARPAFKNAPRNPYNALLYAAVRDQGGEVAEYDSFGLLRGPWDILHIHWPESLLETGSILHARWSAGKYLALIDLARRRGTRVVWTIHDLKPHDLVYPAIETRFWDAVLARVDGLIALTETGLARAIARFPALAGLPAFVIPHGHYRGHYPNSISRADARARLGLPAAARVITYFGQIRPYKNVPRLIEAVRQIADPDICLQIAGRLSKRVDMRQSLIEAAAGDPRIRLVLGFVEDAEVQLFLNSANLLVFPYQDILNSGSALLGLSFDRPVLVPDLGAMAELQRAVGPAWVRTYAGDLDGATLVGALAWATGIDRAATAPLAAFDWAGIARDTLAAFAAIAARPPATPATLARAPA